MPKYVCNVWYADARSKNIKYLKIFCQKNNTFENTKIDNNQIARIYVTVTYINTIDPIHLCDLSIQVKTETEKLSEQVTGICCEIETFFVYLLETKR